MTVKLFGKVREAKQKLAGTWAIEKMAHTDIKEAIKLFESDPKKYILDVSEKIEEENDKKKTAGAFFDMSEPIDSERVLSFNESGTEATIRIEGPLVDTHNCATLMFGCTSYDDLILAIQEVNNLSSIEKTVFEINSPGGMVSGVDGVASAIKDMKSKTEARSGKMVASAAYWIASQCDTIVATDPTAQFGSIGVVIEYWDSSRLAKEMGYDKVCITSTNATDKRVDPLSEEGERKVRAGLDEIEGIFHRRVAEGRNVTTSIVAANFGKGGMFLSEKSLKAGMIDKTDFVLKNNINKETITKDENQMESKMNLNEYTAKHPEGQKEIDALVAAAVKTNADENEKENKRVSEEATKNTEAASKYLSSEYPEKVKTLAIQVIKGEKSLDGLETAVSILDLGAEKTSSDAATKETEEAGDTPSDKVTEADESKAKYASDIARMKKLK